MIITLFLAEQGYNFLQNIELIKKSEHYKNFWGCKFTDNLYLSKKIRKLWTKKYKKIENIYKNEKDSYKI